MNALRILFIATSHDKIGDTGKKTGVWLEELAAPYYIFKDGGAVVTLSSPNGGLVPLDPKSQAIMTATSSTKRFLIDFEAMKFLSQAIPLDVIQADNYDAVFIAGGHGALWDIAGNTEVKRVVEDFFKQTKLVGAICHGVAGLLSLQNEQGETLLKGKQLTGFSNSEEESAGLTAVVPFLVETELTSLGAVYTKGANYVSYIVEDGNLLTGQNAASSKDLANKMVAYLKINKPFQQPELVSNETV
jgi:putative intracellular protease/amidase